jgi:signal transduction histidine kinase
MELETDIETALKDIRRLVYRLRPPALDDLGLVAAIRETAMQYQTPHAPGEAANTSEQLRIEVEAPEPLSPLPAAVEVAAYRITQEALTNVVRHARARSCLVRLSVDERRLCLEIIDDGVGLAVERRAGVGLASMRERATELGGTVLIETRAPGGTRLLASLPLSSRSLPDPTVNGGEAGGENGAARPDRAAALPRTHA